MGTAIWIVVAFAAGLAVGPGLRALRRAGEASREIYRLAAAAAPHYQASAHPRDLRDDPAFVAGVEHLLRPDVDDTRRLEYARGDNEVIACMAFEALGRAGPRDEGGDPLREALLDLFPERSPWAMWFALRALVDRAAPDARLLGPILVHLGEDFDVEFNRFYLATLREIVAERIAAGEEPTFAGALPDLPPEAGETLRTVLGRLDPAVGRPLLRELRAHRTARVDTAFLETIGRIWRQGEGDLAEPLVESRAMRERVASLQAILEAPRPRSVVLVGEAGVGKTALARLLGRRLLDAGWAVFEAGAQELLAGQSFHGQLEARLQELLRRLTGGARVVWYVPDLHELLLAGRHRYSTSGVLDVVLPHVEAGRLTMLTEARPEPYDHLSLHQPRLATAFQVSRLESTGEAETLELAERWGELHRGEGAPPLLDDDVLREAWQLTQQFLGSRAAPGNLLRLLELTRQRLEVGEEGSDREVVLRTGDLIATVSQVTGLPAAILDERQGLDLDALERAFRERVMGQPEAVRCLVERVAMIKAGVCDPRRPLGVFLFAGPTGTGKTEIAKALARFLFGAADRMLRLDMSELQSPGGLSRVFGPDEGEPPAGRTGGSLVEQIRRQPFSVVLLDEIEKAHPAVWDLFLQVFDDGRLTDPRGAVADFRHSIVIMTSNLGAAIAAGASLGFSRETGTFSAHDVQRGLERTFRKEFLNRIDRVVVFRPLPREVMRRILERELADAFRRRGLRNRQWAVEWSDEAVEFLLEEGFTPDLGARPLQRAIERHLLAPLALATVHREIPTGDQFLFLGSDGTSLTVEFVDPEADDPAPGPEPGREGPDRTDDGEAGTTLESLVVRARGSREELELVRARHERLVRRLEAPEWKERKAIALSMTELPDFWDSPERFTILGQAEALDRIDSGLRTAGSLARRLSGERDRAPAGLVRKLAQQVFLLEAAATALENGSEWDAYLSVEVARGLSSHAEPARSFAAEIAAMYRSWARIRRMRVRDLPAQGSETTAVLAVSGYAAYDLLAPEAGIHVLEIPSDGSRFERLPVRVRVARQPAGPALSASAEGKTARSLLADDAHRTDVVRRYRREPSPLVRDAVRGWRTGRLDLVLEGNFDVLAPAPEAAGLGETGTGRAE